MGTQTVEAQLIENEKQWNDWDEECSLPSAGYQRYVHDTCRWCATTFDLVLPRNNAARWGNRDKLVYSCPECLMPKRFEE